MMRQVNALMGMLCVGSALSAQGTAPADTATPISTKTAEHYRWGDCCDGWYLTKTPQLHVIEERLPPGSGEKLHFHHKSTQFFYVLEGKAQFIIDGKTVLVNAREGVRIPPKSPHRVESVGETNLVILVISQPPSQGDRVNLEP